MCPRKGVPESLLRLLFLTHFRPHGRPFTPFNRGMIALTLFHRFSLSLGFPIVSWVHQLYFAFFPSIITLCSLRKKINIRTLKLKSDVFFILDLDSIKSFVF